MPDLNSVPASPHSLAASRRQSSQAMPPPPLPAPTSPSLNILPSNQNAVHNAAIPSSLSLGSPRLAPSDNTGVGPGPGPVRHPRPLTAAELHQELEKEQEAVVNRLTRELDLLRAAQNASVVSNTSSTSASASNAEVPHIPDGRQHLLSGTGFSIPSNSGRPHHRSASNASIRSTAATTAGSSTWAVGITAPAPIRPGATPLSRQNSTQSHSRQSLSGSPAPHGSYSHSHMADAAHSGYFHLRSPPAAPTSIPAATPGSTSLSELSPGMMPATSRYEETAFFRQELDTVKRENDMLKRRIRELERMVRERRASDAGRPRSESVSTTASASTPMGGTGPGASIARPREGRVVSMLSTTGSVGVGVPEEEVKVGESAASAGLGGQASQDSQPSQTPAPAPAP